MNLMISHSDKLNINGIKAMYDNTDYIENNIQSKLDKTTHLHGKKPLKIRFFANGDKFFPGKKISLHAHRYRNMDELLSELTSKMPPQVYLPNGIRQIFSPGTGKRILEVTDLEGEHDYVCAGNESFKNITYGNNDKEPWFRGRPQNFSRYAPFVPFGLGVTPNNNLDQRLDGQSMYANQNAFPTRFYRQTGPGYNQKNVIGRFPYSGAAVPYPKLIKFKSKANGLRNTNFYQDLLNQQVRPKVITVVKSGPEKPKAFVRILLNKRSVQSYETLVSDIESSLKDQSLHKLRGIGRIYNLLGKEIKSVGDFFRNEDFFIAAGDQEQVTAKHVKEILDDMYPDHPQTTQILQYWTTKKSDIVSYKDTISEPDKSSNILGSSISVDKRDSGFDEQDFSHESEYNSVPNLNEISEVSALPKPKLSTSKPTISRKAKIKQNKEIPTPTQTSVTEMKAIQSSDRGLEVALQQESSKTIQEQNAERLRAAYEERERARVQIQEQLKLERKRLEEQNISVDNSYSQSIKKSIGERGSIDVFKKMDLANQEARKQKIRQKINKKPDKSPYGYVEVMNESLPIVSSTSPQTDSSLDLSTNSNESNSNSKSKQQNLDISPKVIRKLNKISEVTNENLDEQDTVKIKNSNSDLKSVPSKSKRHKFDLNTETTKPENKDRFSEDNRAVQTSTDVEEVRKENVPPVDQPSVNSNEYPNVSNAVIKSDEFVDDSSQVNKSNDEKLSPISHQNILFNSKAESSSDVPSSRSQYKGVAISSQTPLDNSPANQNVSPDKTTETNPVHDKKLESSSHISQAITESPKKVVNAEPPLPGSIVMGKLCRQISSSDVIYQRYEVTKLLGDGNFAVVKFALRRDNKREYALKIIDKAKMRGKESMIENEIWIMKLCHHDNIIRLKEEFETKDEVFLVMELVKGGDLFDAITQSVKFTEPVAAKMVIDMANALFYLHSRRIVHRDLKPENLLVLRHKDGSITLKLADFGLAMEVKKLIYTVCGTPTYVAPEILTERGYSIEVDLWALGVITYILLCGFPPFRSPNRDQEQLFEMIKSGKFDFISPYWDKISSDVKDLIRRLLVVDRKSRYSTIHVLSHKWIMSRGGPSTVTEDFQRQRSIELEKEAQLNLEDFQRQKKDLRISINREIQAAYLSQTK